MSQVEIKLADLRRDMAVRITFKPYPSGTVDRSYREVIWNVDYADERSAILTPIMNACSYTLRGRIFDQDEVNFWDARSLVEVLKELIPSTPPNEAR